MQNKVTQPLLREGKGRKLVSVLTAFAAHQKLTNCFCNQKGEIWFLESIDISSISCKEHCLI